jgi:hypothetical protein
MGKARDSSARKAAGTSDKPGRSPRVCCSRAARGRRLKIIRRADSADRTVSAGGNVDITARTIAPPLGEVLGQSVVVDNRPAPAAAHGANLVARAAPDGYTLLMGSSAPLSINTIVLKDVPYDGTKDFAPVSTVHVVTWWCLQARNLRRPPCRTWSRA